MATDNSSQPCALFVLYFLIISTIQLVFMLKFENEALVFKEKFGKVLPLSWILH